MCKETQKKLMLRNGGGVSKAFFMYDVGGDSSKYVCLIYCLLPAGELFRYWSCDQSPAKRIALGHVIYIPVCLPPHFVLILRKMV
jgi:hypothetical protein